MPCPLPPASPPGGGAGAGGAGGGGGGSSAIEQPKRDPAPPPTPKAPEVVESVPAPIVRVELPAVDPFDELRPTRPTLRSYRYRRGVLRLSVDGFKRGERVVFRVTQRVGRGRRARLRTRTYVRSSPMLTLRVQRWTKVTVQLRRPGIGSSKPLTIRRNHEF